MEEKANKAVAQIAHYAVAAWGAVGGVARMHQVDDVGPEAVGPQVIHHFQHRLIDELGVRQLEARMPGSLWNIEQSIEVTLADGTKVRVSSERDVDLALKTIRKLKDGLLDTPKNP